MGRVAFILTVLCCLFTASLAGADGPEEQANIHYNEGKELLAQGELRQALDCFDKAWNIFQHPLILKKRAETRERLFEYEEAIVDYRMLLDLLPRRARAEKRRVTERIQSLESLLARPVTVNVLSAPLGVLIGVGESEARRTPFDVELVPGSYVFSARDPNFGVETQTVRVRAGQAVTVRLAPAARTGQIVIRTDQGSFAGIEVAVDSEVLDIDAETRASPVLASRALVIGTHRLMCRVPGNPGYYIEFEVQEGVESQVVCALEGLLWDPMQDTWGWVTASSGIASTLAGTILLVSYALDVQTAAQSNQILVTNKDWLGGVLLGVGVVLGASSYFVFMRNEPEATPAEETPQSSLWVLPLPEGGALFQGSLRF